MTEEGKKSLKAELIAIPDAHQKFINEMQSCLEFSSVPTISKNVILKQQEDDDDDDDDDDDESFYPHMGIQMMVQKILMLI